MGVKNSCLEYYVWSVPAAYNCGLGATQCTPWILTGTTWKSTSLFVTLVVSSCWTYIRGGPCALPEPDEDWTCQFRVNSCSFGACFSCNRLWWRLVQLDTLQWFLEEHSLTWCTPGSLTSETICWEAGLEVLPFLTLSRTGFPIWLYIVWSFLKMQGQ